MSLRVDYDERAISQAAEFLDDPQGIRAVLDAIDRLADDPRPAGRFPGRPGGLVLVQAFRFGRIDNGAFASLPGTTPRILPVSATW